MCVVLGEINVLVNIVETLDKKNWKVYATGINGSISNIDAQGPVSELEVDQNYSILPKAQNVRNSLSKLNKYPVLTIKGIDYNFIKFSTSENGIEISDEEGSDKFSYDTFLNALHTIEYS